MAGGTVRYEWNMDALRGTGVIILLNARINTLVQRAMNNDRPRVNPVSDLKADLILLWKEKRHLYYGAADLLYRTDRNKTVKQEAEEIIKMLKKKKLPGPLTATFGIRAWRQAPSFQSAFFHRRPTLIRTYL